MRRFEFKDARSYKFWEIQVEGNAFTVRYGKVGTDGVTQTKSYANADKAKAEAEKKIREKTNKGYAEVASAPVSTPAAATSPDDDWAVLADKLQAAGDPWGERIAVFRQWDEAKGKAKAPFKKRLNQLDEEHGEHFYGAALLALMAEENFEKTARLKWDSGYIVEARVGATDYDHEGPDPGEVMAALMKSPAVAHLRKLTLGLPAYDDTNFGGYIRSIAATKLEKLDYLFIGDFEYPEQTELSWAVVGDVDKLLPAVPNLRTLRVRGAAIGFASLEHPKLQRLEIETGGLPRESIAGIAAAKAPELAHLEVWFGRRDYGGSDDITALDALWANPNLPQLKHLGLQNAEMQDQIAAALANSKILAQVESVDMSMGTMHEPGARAILAAADSFKHLKSLNLEDNFITGSEYSQLHTAFGSRVNLRSQRAPDDWGDGVPRYYTAVGE